MKSMFELIEKKVDELKAIVESNGYEYDYYTIPDEVMDSTDCLLKIEVVAKNGKSFMYDGGDVLVDEEGNKYKLEK